MDVVGEAFDWPTTLAEAPMTNLEMLLVEWSLLPPSPSAALVELRTACPHAIIVVLISHLDTRQQAALSAGADAFISKGETPDRIADRLRAAAERVQLLITHPSKRETPDRIADRLRAAAKRVQPLITDA